MKRLQFELPEERVLELDNLAERTGLKTRVQLLNTALTLFEWAVREREAGRIIASLDEGNAKYKEIDMPGFPNENKKGSKKTRTSEKTKERSLQWYAHRNKPGKEEFR